MNGVDYCKRNLVEFNFDGNKTLSPNWLDYLLQNMQVEFTNL